MNIKTMENKVKVWIARDKDGKLYAHSKRPNKMKIYWENEVYAEIFRLDSSLFPSVKWEDDEPTEAYITLAEPQEQPKQEQPTKEIDWEQRRYEITKEMTYKIYRQEVTFSKQGQGIFEWNGIADGAVELADMLIEKLKKRGEK